MFTISVTLYFGAVRYCAEEIFYLNKFLSACGIIAYFPKPLFSKRFKIHALGLLKYILRNFNTGFRYNPEKGFTQMGMPQQLISCPGKCYSPFFDEKRFGRRP
jgi:hypothetical protein